jgi:hypothetical protein
VPAGRKTIDNEKGTRQMNQTKRTYTKPALRRLGLLRRLTRFSF